MAVNLFCRYKTAFFPFFLLIKKESHHCKAAFPFRGYESKVVTAKGRDLQFQREIFLNILHLSDCDCDTVCVCFQF